MYLNTAFCGWALVPPEKRVLVNIFWMLSVLLVAGVCASGAEAGRMSAAPHTRVALVSSWKDIRLAKVLALAEADLSRAEEIVLLERTQIDRIFEELGLWQRSNASSAAALRRVLPLDVFVALEGAPDQEEAVGLIVFDAHSGVRLADVTLAAGDVVRQADEITGVVLKACAKRADPASGLRSICLVSTRCATLSKSLSSVGDTIGRMLERRLANSSTLLVLERARLEQLNKEAFASGPSRDVLLPSLTLLDLNIGDTDDLSGHTAHVRLADAKGASLGDVRVPLDPADVYGSTERILKGLQEALRAAPVPDAPDREQEAGRFRREYRVLADNGDYAGALRAIEAAAALSPTNMPIQWDLTFALARKAVELARALPPAGADPPQPDLDGRLTETLDFAFRAINLQEAVVRYGVNSDYTVARKLLVSPGGLRNAFPGGRACLEELVLRYPYAAYEHQAKILEFQSALNRIYHEILFPHRCDRAINEGKWIDLVSTDLCYYSASMHKFVDSARKWTTTTAKLFDHWLRVHAKYSLSTGGWIKAPSRAMARLCWLVNRGDDLSVNDTRLRVKGWTIGEGDIGALCGILDTMAGHSDPIIAAYGRIGRFARSVRGAKSLDPEQQERYERIRVLLLDVIADPAGTYERWSRDSGAARQLPEEKIERYRALAYTALRDAIDFIPDDRICLAEHERLFRHALSRREGIHTTIQMAVDPETRRFLQYDIVSDTFAGSAVQRLKREKDEYPTLLANAEQALEMIRRPDCKRVDIDWYVPELGSFERQLDTWRQRVLDASPELIPVAKPPWDRAERLYAVTADNNSIGRILASTIHKGTLYFAVHQLRRGMGELVCVAISLKDGMPKTIGISDCPQSPDTEASGMAFDRGAVYVGISMDGVYRFPVAGRAQRLDIGECLPIAKIQILTCMNGSLFAALNGGFLVRYDLQTRQCHALVSAGRRDKQSPLDDASPPLEVTCMLNDPQRERVLFATRFGSATCHPLLGLWSLDAKTFRMSHLLQMNQPVTHMDWNMERSLLMHFDYAYWKWNCGPFTGVVVVDADADTGRLLAGSTGSGEIGPHLSHEGAARFPIHANPPHLLVDGWLWLCLNEGEWRVSMASGDLRKIPHPDAEGSKQAMKWQRLYHDASHRLIIGVTARGVWRMFLPMAPAPPSTPG